MQFNIIALALLGSSSACHWFHWHHSSDSGSSGSGSGCDSGDCGSNCGKDGCLSGGNETPADAEYDEAEYTFDNSTLFSNETQADAGADAGVAAGADSFAEASSASSLI